MSCFRPLSGALTPAGAFRFGVARGDERHMDLPCGKCVGCRQDRARAWSIRITHEAQLYVSNLFVTLTYDDEHLPVSRSLEYRDFQLFMKRVRRQLVGVSPGPDGRHPIRFFAAGEYGTLNKRPHWHAILFNVAFPDARPMVNGDVESRLAEELWSCGRVHIGSVTAASAAYVAGYVNQKQYGAAARDALEDVVDLSTGEVCSRRAEFCVMSRRPGIGAWWYQRYGRDLFPNDMAVQEGKAWKVPRYYHERFKREADAGVVEEIAYKRYLKAQERREDATPERRAVREGVARARQVHFAKRDL